MTEYNLIRKLLFMMTDADATRLIVESGKIPRFVIREKTAISVIGEPVLSRTELYLAAIDLMIKLEDRKIFTLAWGKNKQDPGYRQFAGRVTHVGDSIKIEFRYIRQPDHSRSVINNTITDLIDGMTTKDVDKLVLDAGSFPNYRKKNILEQKFGPNRLSKDEIISDLEALGLYQDGKSLDGSYSHISEDENLNRILKVHVENSAYAFYAVFEEAS
jgi:hypothetical protein